MKKPYDFSKTQFFLVPGENTMRAFRRKRMCVMFSDTGEALRAVDWNDWQEQKLANSDCTFRSVWTLVEVK